MAKGQTQSAGLSREQLGQLEAAVLEFDRHWTTDLLTKYGDRLAPGDLRKPALEALISVDLERRWAAGESRKVEDYLSQFPELGRTADASAELILSEYQARESTGHPLSVDELTNRFPAQAEQVRRLIEQAADSQVGDSQAGDVSVQASIDTSRAESDTNRGRSATASPLPERFGRYQIMRQLGSGAMGAVYLAHDSQLDRQVALKTPKLGEGQEGGELVERFYREARAAANLRHHNICPVHDVGQIDGVHYISMAYIDGRPLSDYTKSEKLIPARTAGVILRKLAQALSVAHGAGVIHRDLKPSNVMVDQRREPVVMDFGLARRSEGAEQSNITQSGVILGTPAYMSPEQVEGDPNAVGPASDQYSLGVILYEMLCGQLPFKGSVTAVIGKIMSQTADPPSKRRKGVEPKLEAICMRMMAKNATERFASMDEVAAALGEWLKSQADSTPDADIASPESKIPLPQGMPVAQLVAPATRIPPGASAPEVAVQVPATRTVKRQATSAPPTHSKSFRTWWIAGAAFAAVVLLTVVLMLPTPEGMLRIEISDPDLDVLVDGQSVRIKDNQWEGPKKAIEHGLSLRLGGVDIPFNTQQKEFTTQQGKLFVRLDNAELTSNRFEVARRGTTVLKITFQPSRPKTDNPQSPRSGDSPAGGAIAKSLQLTAPRLLCSFDHHGSQKTNTGYFAKVSPDGMRVAFRMTLEPPQLLATESAQSFTLPPEFDAAISLDYDRDGHRFATGHADGTIRLWDAKTAAPLGQPFTLSDTARVGWVSLSDDGARLFAVTQEKPPVFHAWRVATRERIGAPISLADESEGNRAINSASNKSLFIAATKDGRAVFVLDPRKETDTLRRWDGSTSQWQDSNLVLSEGKLGPVFGFDVSPQGDHVATVSKQGTCRLFDAKSGRELWSRSYAGRLVAIRFSPSGKQLAVSGGLAGSDDMHLLDVETSKELFRWRVPVDESLLRTERFGGWVTYLSFSRDGSRLLTTGVNTPVCVWSLSAEDKLPATVVRTASDSATKVETPAQPDPTRPIAAELIQLGAYVVCGGNARYTFRVEDLPPGDLRISTVSLHGNNVEVRNEHLALLAQLPNLESVRVGETSSVTAEGFKALANIRTLKRITFAKSPLTDEGLAALQQLPVLGMISLYHTDVTNDGLAVLKDFPELTHLTISEASKTRKFGVASITDDGLVHLADVKKLKKLWVVGPNYTDRAIEHLAKLKQVRSMLISSPKITAAGIARLKRELPECAIVDKGGADGFEESIPDLESMP